MEVPHGSADSEGTYSIAVEAGVHIKRTLAHENGSVQVDCGRMAGGGAIFGVADSGEAAENGI